MTSALSFGPSNARLVAADDRGLQKNSSSIASFAPVQVQGIDPRTTGMKIAAGICSCVGPLMFLGYFLFGYLRKKNV